MKVVKGAVFVSLHERSVWVKVMSWIHVRAKLALILPEFIQPSPVSNKTVKDTQRNATNIPKNQKQYTSK